MKVRIAMFAAFLGCLAAYAGEIVIIQPAEKDTRSTREPTRSERELGRTMDKARQYGGTGSAAPIVIDEASGSRPLDKAEQSIRDAQDYLRSGSGSAGMSGMGGTTVILRAVPPSETEKLRQKARSYVAPENAGRTVTCGEVSNTVGTIGGLAGNERTSSVSEKGNSAVNVNCK